VDRLKEAGLKRVHGALEFAGLQQHPGTLPAYFVLPTGWRAQENKLAGAHDQLVSEDFAVLIVLNATARREDAVAEDLHDEETRILGALTGWKHPDASRACEATSGQLVSVDGHALGWRVGFRTGRHIRKREAT
jgi:hypothetical protein